MIRLLGLVGDEGYPWAWLALRSLTDVEMIRAVREAEHEASLPHGDWTVERGWGRWRPVQDVDRENREPGDMEWFGDGWPIPLLNRRYTIALPVEDDRE